MQKDTIYCESNMIHENKVFNLFSAGHLTLRNPSCGSLQLAVPFLLSDAMRKSEENTNNCLHALK